MDLLEFIKLQHNIQCEYILSNYLSHPVGKLKTKLYTDYYKMKVSELGLGDLMVIYDSVVNGYVYTNTDYIPLDDYFPKDESDAAKQLERLQKFEFEYCNKYIREDAMDICKFLL